jgi:ATP-dependent DNA helicase RecG
LQNKDKLLNTPVQYLKGIGEKRALALETIGIFSFSDLMQYYPRRYLDRSNITPIRNLKINETATVVGKVQTCGIKKGARQRFILVLTDETGFLSCVWFHQIQFWQKRFKPGQLLAVSGKIGYFGGKQIIHPDFDLLSEESENLEDDFLHTGAIIPIYSSTEKLSRIGLDSRGFRRIIKYLIQNHVDSIEETLPHSIVLQNKLLPFSLALKNIHFPDNFQMMKQAQQRLKFEELFLLQFMLALRKQKIHQQQSGIVFSDVGDRTKLLAEQLPFELTKAQKKVLKEIRRDMKNSQPMYRLIQGDVGSGKTIVALVTMLIAVENGYQATLMAPTEILAEQHFLTFRGLLADMDVNIQLLIGAQKKSIRNSVTSQIENGECNIVIGTHAIIQENIKFKNLGLVVIDEQHRFGVSQRAELFEKGKNPDVLVMTATPIPRTLSLTVYGDLDVSIIDELPSGRKPVKTTWRYSNKRSDIYKFVKSKVDQGSQTYIVFPLIEESEKLDLQAATESYEKMQQGIFADNKIMLLHGRKKSEEKEAIMASFKKGETQILVSTTVIEVGVDVPNATIMLIENAERFGLTQLHQLRGRVGRGSEQSYCILIGKYPLTEEALTRLNTMAKTTDGFRIAEVDLELRGPGEFFGTRQHGLPELKIANPLKDSSLLIQARKEAFRIAETERERNELTDIVKCSSFFQNYKDKIEMMQIG